VFDRVMPGPNQIDRQRDDVRVSAADLLKVPGGTITEAGLRMNLSVGVIYIANWLGGLGCVPINNLMEDAATAEISRAQVWQWLRHGARIDGGPVIDRALVRRLLDEELAKIEGVVGADRFADGHYREAAELFHGMLVAEKFEEFLTLPAYERVVTVKPIEGMG
jgi:malate synthase